MKARLEKEKIYSKRIAELNLEILRKLEEKDQEILKLKTKLEDLLVQQDNKASFINELFDETRKQKEIIWI